MKRQYRKWPEPKDAYLVLDMHTRVVHIQPKLWYAEITVALEVSDVETVYFTVGASEITERRALRRAIRDMENEFWFQYFRQRGIVFKVFGVLEDVYRGYLT